MRSPTPAPAHKVAGLDSEPRACWAKTHARRKEGSRLRGLALRPEFRLKARSPSIEPPGTGDDKSRGKQSSSCRASRRPQNGPSPPTERPLLGFYGIDRQLRPSGAALSFCTARADRVRQRHPLVHTCKRLRASRNRLPDVAAGFAAAASLGERRELALPDVRHRGNDHVS